MRNEFRKNKHRRQVKPHMPRPRPHEAADEHNIAAAGLPHTRQQPPDSAEMDPLMRETLHGLVREAMQRKQHHGPATRLYGIRNRDWNGASAATNAERPFCFLGRQAP
jgi:hypothetical protein